MNKKILFTAVAALGLSLSSCDSYLDINTDPNSPSEGNISSDMIMPTVEMNIASSYGNFLRIAGGYHAQIYGHLFGTSNYVDYSQFKMSATRSRYTYTQFTQRGLSNIQTILEKAESEEEWGTYLAATVLRAFTYAALVDCYGEIPYTEALNDGITQPAYDDGEVIYEGIIAEIDAALEKASSADLVCTNFLFPDEDATNWIRFANALKLKLLVRMADVADVQSRLAALVAEDNFPEEDIAYTDCWANESGSMSPFYAEEFSTSWGSTQINVAANTAIIGTMYIENEYTDPRLAAFFEPNDDGEYLGSVSGTNYSNSDLTSGSFNRPVASYDMPVYYITVAEVEFFLAEYYARYGSSSDAAAHYASAVEASFASAGVDGAAEWVARYPFSSSNYKKSLGEAKWVALSGVNPFEAWCELRRLDYPAFDTTIDGDDLWSPGQSGINSEIYTPFTLYTPISVFAQVGSNRLLERYPYPESSTARNANAPEFPGYTTPVFWAE